MEEKMAPVHPVGILFDEFLEPRGLSQNKLAREISVPPRRINEIIHGKRAITADTALRLGRYFGTTAQLCINLQTHYALEIARDRIDAQLASITPHAHAEVA